MKTTIAAMMMLAAAPVLSAETTVRWSTLGNTTGPDGRPCYVQRFEVPGNTGFARLAFNQFARQMQVANPADTLVEIVPGYYCIASPRFAAAGAGDTVTVDLVTRGSFRSICYAPDGVHGVKADGTTVPVRFERADIIADPSLWVSVSGEDVMPYGPQVYRRNEALNASAAPGFYDVIPSYKEIKLTGDFSPEYKGVRYAPAPEDLPEGRWRVILADGYATIEAREADRAQALSRLAPLNLQTGGFPEAVITDGPDFPYRGIMIDIARNYQTPAEMDRILELMARYGLNTLHFHFADDEAWRLEIPDFPELTEMGGRRGYTTDEKDFMAQLFAGDGNPSNLNGTSNGYFTRDEFIAMLRKAQSLGIRVLPEIESPGHARVAVKAMERRFRETGDDTYRLADPADTSRYTSAQAFHDNVMNPALPGPVRFMSAMARRLKAMYDEAGVEMPALHIGGDEVAKGAWTGSPVAREYMQRHGMTDERLLHLIFITELTDSLTSMGIPVSGWQEIAVGHDEAFNNKVRPHVFSVNCWSTLGDQSSVTAQSARAGYPTVLSNVDHFYMDMCYSPHPYERGLSWGGYVDEFDALHGYPAQLCKVGPADFANVIGLSGHVFAETIRGPEGIETMILPKMLGLAERAWNADTTYTDAAFNSVINVRERPVWNTMGVAWHVRQPGVMVKDGRVVMNTSYGHNPGIEIRYTTDGSLPDRNSTLYTGPFEVPVGVGRINAVTVDGNGMSVPTVLIINNNQQ